MKPRKLKIMGLNSFVEEQEIDFSLLTEKGFFGIFGPTGSGKSTILDAITIALYGEISRSSQRKLEFINSSKADMNIYYEFEMGSNHDRKVYSIERHYKRKKDGGISCDKAILREIYNEGYDILSESSKNVTESIEEIVGLKCDDFTRSVVLPQGRFSDFLKLTKGDRGKMLERILNLEEFGSKMAFKIKGEIISKKSCLDVINGALSRYDGITEEVYEKKKQELKLLQEQEEILKTDKIKLQIEYENANMVWELQKELEIFRARKEELLLSEDEIKNKKITLSKSRLALNVKPFLDNSVDSKNKIELSERELQKINRNYNEMVEIVKKTENDYIIAYDKKDKELPMLIEKESKLNEAIKLDEEIVKLEKDINSMRKEYHDLKAHGSKIEGELKNIHKEKGESLKTIEIIDDKIALLKVTPEHREKVIEALSIEKEYNEQNIKVSEISSKIKELGSQIATKKIELEVVAENKKKTEESLIELEKYRKAMEDNSPGDSRVIYEKQAELTQMNNILSEATLNNSILLKTNGEVSVLENHKKDVIIKLNSITAKLEDLRKKLNVVKVEIENIEKKNIVGIVAQYIVSGEACPVCGSVHHPNIAEKGQNIDLEEKRSILSQITKSIDDHIELENEVRIELVGYEKELNLKHEVILELKNKLYGIDITSLEENKAKFEDELNILKAKIEVHSKNVKLSDEELEKLKDEINKVSLSYAQTSTELSKDNSQFNSLTLEEDKIKGKLDLVLRKYKDIKDELAACNIQEENNRIKKCTIEEEKERNKQVTLRQRIIELDNLRNEIELKKVEVYNNMENVKVSGQERNDVMKGLIDKKNDYSDNKNPNEYIIEVKSQIRSIREHEANLRNTFESERKILQKLGEEKSNGEKNIITLKELLLENEQKLVSALKENNFENADEAINSMISKENMAAYENEIKEFEGKAKTTSDNISRITKKLDNKTIDGDNWNSINIRKKDNEEQRDKITRLIAGEQKSIEGMEKNFEEIKVLSKQKKAEEHELSLLNDIMELISGNKFVEFAATNQLKYISLEASRRLREITRGRYALELDSSNEFVMRDDFSGGIRRSADTLSGGETFLTSLCLALSLSSNIQLKGNSPLEFFFLDEGFGSLDVDLLEVVISSLERLRSDKLCVGIISHVEELKNRVPIKLLVTPANIEGSGTKVLIEYS